MTLCAHKHPEDEFVFRIGFSLAGVRACNGTES